MIKKLINHHEYININCCPTVLQLLSGHLSSCQVLEETSVAAGIIIEDDQCNNNY